MGLDREGALPKLASPGASSLSPEVGEAGLGGSLLVLLEGGLGTPWPFRHEASISGPEHSASSSGHSAGPPTPRPAPPLCSHPQPTGTCLVVQAEPGPGGQPGWRSWAGGIVREAGALARP